MVTAIWTVVVDLCWFRLAEWRPVTTFREGAGAGYAYLSPDTPDLLSINRGCLDGLSVSSVCATVHHTYPKDYLGRDNTCL